MPCHDPLSALTRPADKATLRFNEFLLQALSRLPAPATVPPEEIRRLQRDGQDTGTPPAHLASAETIFIPRHSDNGALEEPGTIGLRLFWPMQKHKPEESGIGTEKSNARETRKVTGAYLYLHGGGWIYGAADLQDTRLQALADRTNLLVLAVDYRLAPEHPFPAGLNDCVDAAQWLTTEGREQFGLKRFAIGGSSAGANLAAATLVRIRDHTNLMPFHSAVFISGCFDLRMTPSARAWGTQRLIINTEDMAYFIRSYLGDIHDPWIPEISPLCADLKGLPAAYFSVGTADPLLDDTLFMAARWRAAGNTMTLHIAPGGCHVFENFPISIAEESNKLIDSFLIMSDR